MEKIGGVSIDDTHYSGKDLYCDGPVEDELLKIVQTRDSSEYRTIIEESKSWPIFYHLSEHRQNIVKWITLSGKEKILEVGSGCGAITGALADGAKVVDCVELSKKRSLINAYRNSDKENITIHLGNFMDVEPDLNAEYDYIFLIGVLEYAISYIGGEHPFEDFIKILKKHLKYNGQIVIAIENRMGLKYLAGCKEDHLASYFSGVEGYPDGGVVRTFTRPALEKIFKNAGLSKDEIHFYYPYPDYKFMTTLFSDKRLPLKGELSTNLRNFDAERMLLFDEKEAFDACIEEGSFPYFSNSYLVVLGDERENVYVKYSNDRACEYSICTGIIEDIFNETKSPTPARMVIKYPMFEEAAAHTGKLEESYKKLSSQYYSNKLSFNRCAMNGDVAVLDYIWGETLEEKLDEKCRAQDEEGFTALVKEYMERITPKPMEVLLKENEIETESEGESEGENKTVSLLYDEDLIFSNILIDRKNWTVIDYEWVTEEEITVKEMTARALYCYSLGSVKRKKMALEVMQKLLDMGQDDYNRIAKAETKFQHKATGDTMSLTELRNEFARPIIPATRIAHEYMDNEHRMRIQVYEDYGKGFSEEESRFLVSVYEEGKATNADVDVTKDIVALRVDPCIDYCIVKIDIIEIEGVVLTLKDKSVVHNGMQLGTDTLVFNTQDPWLQINFDKRLMKKLKKLNGEMEEMSVRVRFVTNRLPQEMIEAIIG